MATLGALQSKVAAVETDDAQYRSGFRQLDGAGAREALPATPLRATTLRRMTRAAVPRWRQRAVEVAGDLMTALLVIFSIPFVILAVGLPIVACVRLVLWVARAL
jgi:hypothetical protein